MFMIRVHLLIMHIVGYQRRVGCRAALGYFTLATRWQVRSLTTAVPWCPLAIIIHMVTYTRGSTLLYKNK